MGCKVDIDQCTTGTDNNCDDDATCTNTDGSFTCSCNTGYTGDGVTCTALQCRTLTAPANGFLSPVGANSYQDVVTFTCDQGYKLGGASSVTCQADRTWSAPVPTCQPLQCPTLTAPANGFLSPVGANSYQDVVTFTCDQGYGLDGASSVRCQADRTWSAPVPTCYHIDQCTTGTDNCDDDATCTNTDGSFTCSCNTGYTGDGVTCTALQCRTLMAPANGALSPVGANSYQDVVTFTCDQGYGLDGAYSVRCQAGQTWSAPVPTCQPLQCPTLTAPANGFLSPVEANSYQDVVTFTCDQGYGLNGASSVTCQADRTWSAPVPTCQLFARVNVSLMLTAPRHVNLSLLRDPIRQSLEQAGGFCGDQCKEFTDHLNSLDPDIKFTFDQEKDGALPFLNNNNQDRANTIISDPADRITEIDHVTEALKKCGYPQWLIKKASEPRQPQSKPHDSQGTGGKNRKTLVVLPYVEGVSEPLRRIFAAHGVSQHIHIESPGHTVDLTGVRILDTEQDYFKRGIKEATYIRALQPSLNRDGGRYRLRTTFDPLLTSHIGEIFLHVVSDTNGARKRRQAGDQVLINVIIQLIVVVNQQQGTGDTTDATVTAENLLQQNAYALRQLARSGQLSVDIGGEHIRLVDSSDSSSNCPSGQYKSNGNCAEEKRTPPWLVGVVCAAVVVLVIIAVVTVLLCRRKHTPGTNVPGKSGNEMKNLGTPERHDHTASEGTVDNIIYNTEDEGFVDNVIYNAGDEGTVDNVIYQGENSKSNNQENAPESQYETVN
ncbi:carbohydrate binding [Branchiostoma belcheri]|nr:carbohydrate binding [Branchiostoma belcheri]